MSVAKGKKDNHRNNTAKEEYDTSVFAGIERNQVKFSNWFLLGIHLLNFIVPNSFISKFNTLQYQTSISNDGEILYDIGFDDIYIIIHSVFILTFLRCILMQHVLDYIATHYCKIKSKKGRVRFAEQGWSFFYYTSSFMYGFYLYYHSSYWLSADQIYLGWPHYQHTRTFKVYYLVTIAFWIQQIFVLNIEKRRKDHWQMFSHHIITCSLLFGSYNYYYSRIGHLILMIMDFVDIFLAFAKMLRYCGFSMLCDAMFLIFLLSWVLLRHGLYNYLVYHAYYKAADLMKNARCVPGIEAKRCWTPLIIWIFIALLVGLQVLALVWMYFIIKVAYKVVTGSGADDVRSDEDDTESEDEIFTSEFEVPSSDSEVSEKIAAHISEK